MDCQAALNILESVFPSEDPRRIPEYQEAVSHLDQCDECMDTWNTRKLFDQNLGKTMQSVPFPENMKEKLIAKINENRETSAKQVEVTNPSRDFFKSGQRTLKFALTALSLCFLVGIGFFFMNRSSSDKLEQQLVMIQAEVPGSLNSLEDFQGSFDPVLPDKGWRDQAFTYTSTPRGMSEKNQPSGSGHDRAIYGFELNTHDKNPVRGVLVIYSKNSVRNVPELDRFDSSRVVYLNRGESRFASVSWTSGDLVYVCYVHAGNADDKKAGNSGALESIERVVNLPTV